MPGTRVNDFAFCGRKLVLGKPSRQSLRSRLNASARLTLATDCRRRPQEQCVEIDKNGTAQQMIVAVRHGVLLCVHIRPGESPASALRRSADAAAFPVGDTPGGLPGWILSWGGRAVRDGAGPALESSYGAAGAALCGRLIGGMQAAAGGIGAAAADGALMLATARQTRSRLAACISSVRGLQGLVDRLGRDLRHTDAAGGPKLPVGGVAAEGARGGAVPQGGGHRQPDSVSADAEGITAVKFNEVADDDELLLRVFKDMDTNGDGVISREELDKALESWTGSRELVEALQRAVQGSETGVDIDSFRKLANQVRAREQSKVGEGEGGVRMDMRGQ
jgi:hypothetical protein